MHLICKNREKNDDNSSVTNISITMKKTTMEYFFFHFQYVRTHEISKSILRRRVCLVSKFIPVDFASVIRIWPRHEFITYVMLVNTYYATLKVHKIRNEYMKYYFKTDVPWIRNRSHIHKRILYNDWIIQNKKTSNKNYFTLYFVQNNQF